MIVTIVVNTDFPAIVLNGKTFIAVCFVVKVFFMLFFKSNLKGLILWKLFLETF